MDMRTPTALGTLFLCSPLNLGVSLYLAAHGGSKKRVPTPPGFAYRVLQCGQWGDRWGVQPETKPQTTSHPRPHKHQMLLTLLCLTYCEGVRTEQLGG